MCFHFIGFSLGLDGAIPNTHDIGLKLMMVTQKSKQKGTEGHGNHLIQIVLQIRSVTAALALVFGRPSLLLSYLNRIAKSGWGAYGPAHQTVGGQKKLNLTHPTYYMVTTLIMDSVISGIT